MKMETIIMETKNPMELFRLWFDEAKSTKYVVQPEIMTLATMGKDGCPNARTVLLRGLDWLDAGFKMYWNKHSQKSQELDLNNQASLVFVWSYETKDGQLGSRQVRVQGQVEELLRSEVDAYFESEPDIAKIRAIVQIQSRVITDGEREILRRKCEELWNQVQEGKLKLKCPPDYGGFVLRPNAIEFYQGRKDAINDRIRFRKNGKVSVSPATQRGDGSWTYERLEC